MEHRDIFEWDVMTWSRALPVWEEAVQQSGISIRRGLELGAHNGGISAYFAVQHGVHMTCTDVEEIAPEVRERHQKTGLPQLFAYDRVDATHIPYPDGVFDLVVFKSVLGAVGRNGNAAAQAQALAECYRVLRPGGVLCFAENLKGSYLHQLARRWFVPWGNSWRYVTATEMNTWLASFSRVKLCSTGFFAAFFTRSRALAQPAGAIDKVLQFLPPKYHYVVFGFAVK